MWENEFVPLMWGEMIWVGACLDASVDESSGDAVERSEPFLTECCWEEVGVALESQQFFSFCHRLIFCENFIISCKFYVKISFKGL